MKQPVMNDLVRALIAKGIVNQSPKSCIKICCGKLDGEKILKKYCILKD